MWQKKVCLSAAWRSLATSAGTVLLLAQEGRAGCLSAERLHLAKRIAQQRRDLLSVKNIPVLRLSVTRPWRDTMTRCHCAAA
jgi:hypothetical protein